MSIRQFAERQPLAAAIGCAGLQFLLTVLILKVGAALTPPEAYGKVKLVAFASTIVLPLLLVQALGLWKQVGFDLDKVRPTRLFLVSLLACVLFVSMGIEMHPGFAGEATLQLFNAFGEELLFRGVIFALLLRLSPWRAIAINGVLFGSMHLIHGFMDGNWDTAMTQAVVTAMCGMMFTAVRMGTGSLWLVIALHMLINLSIMHSSIEAAEGTTAMIVERLASAFQVALAGYVAFVATRRGKAVPATG